MEQVRNEGRITRVAYDPALPVDTDWDLGVLDPTAIIFSQSDRNGEIRIIDFEEAEGEGLPYFAQVLARKPYVYGQHWGPHDIQVREFSSGRSRIETAAALGIKFRITPRIHGAAAGEVEEGIHAARLLLSRCWFDQDRTKVLVEALMSYRREYNQRLNQFKDTPVHDSSSHPADAFRGLAVRHQTPVFRQKAEIARIPTQWAWS